MCFTCYFRFIGVYLLLNNEPEGNGNLNRLKSWSQHHQKLPVLYWCSVTTLFAYSAGQMCLLQRFGWNPDSHLHRAGFSSRELSACRKMWVRRLLLCPTAWQGCAYVSPQSSKMCWVIGDTQQSWAHVILTKAGCFSDASQGQGNTAWVAGNRHDTVGACRKSDHGPDALPDDASPAKMSHAACRCSCSQGETQQFWGLDGNFTTCYRQLIKIPESHGILQFQCCHWWMRGSCLF